MSLLLKALSRIEQREPAPAVENLSTDVERQLPVYKSSSTETKPELPALDAEIAPAVPEAAPATVVAEPSGAFELPTPLLPPETEFIPSEIEPTEWPAIEPLSEISAAITSDQLWKQLDDLHDLVTADISATDRKNESDVAAENVGLLAANQTNYTPIAALEPPPTSVPLSAVVATETATPPAPLNVKPEFRELREQLFSRLDISKHPTLLLIDAGREISDSSWLVPFASSVIDKLNKAIDLKPPQILIVEAAGSTCAITQSLGLDAHLGLNHVFSGRANWQSAIQSTPHPQIKLLGRGAESLRSYDAQRFAKLWSELTQQFDLVLVAAGPISQNQQPSSSRTPAHDSATPFFSLATAAILCLELNVTTQAMALEAKLRLDARGIQVLGCIVQPT